MRFHDADYPLWKSAPNVGDHELALGQLRWNPTPIPTEPTDFLAGMRTMTTAGDVLGQAGMAAHVYVANRSMTDDHFFNADGELLIVPQAGRARRRHRDGRDRHRAGRDLRPAARHGVQGRTDRRDGARLCLRELRRQVHAARPRADRRQLPGQSARLQDAGRLLRGQRTAVPADSSNGAAVSIRPSLAIRRSTSSPGTATTRPTNTTSRRFRRSARSCSTIPIRRSSPC